MIADHAAAGADLARRPPLDATPLAVVSAVAEAIGSRAEPGDALDEVVERIAGGSEITAAAIVLLTSDGQPRVRARAGSGHTDDTVLREYVELLAARPVDPGAPSRPLRLPRATDGFDAADEELLERTGARSVLLVPLATGGEQLGVLVLSSETRELSEDWALAARTIGTQITMAVSLSRMATVDVAERRRAEDALRAAQTRLQQVIRASNTVIFAMRIDQDGGALQPVWVSDNIARVMGYPVEDALAKDWWSGHLHPDDRNRVLDAARRLSPTGHSIDEYRFQLRDGSYRWVLDERRVSVDASGKPTEVVGALVDVTDRRSLETQLRQAQKLEGVGQLAGGIAHDFSNVLTAILGNVDILMPDFAPDDPRREGIVEIRVAAEHAATLTRQLLAFSRRHVTQPRVLNLNDVVSSMDRMLRRVLGEDLDYVCRLAPDLAAIEADASQLEQVLLNLALNARDAMPAGGTLTIETRNALVEQPGGHVGPAVVLTVRDTGAGMSLETRARIFEPFFTTKEHGRGTGLGLATVHSIVTQNGGSITVESEPGEGTTFEVYLPPAQRPIEPSSRERERPARPRGTETLLLVEDEASVRRTTRLMLERQGYVVLEADGPTDALAIAARHEGEIDLVLTDVVMPAMSGRELVGLLVTTRPGVRVLYTSGYPGETVAHLIDEEMQFLGKPFTASALAEKVRDVLDTQVPDRK